MTRVRNTIFDSCLIPCENLIDQCLGQLPAAGLGGAIDDYKNTSSAIKCRPDAIPIFVAILTLNGPC
jgi:hypothetical protein